VLEVHRHGDLDQLVLLDPVEGRSGRAGPRRDRTARPWRSPAGSRPPWLRVTRWPSSIAGVERLAEGVGPPPPPGTGRGGPPYSTPGHLAARRAARCAAGAGGARAPQHSERFRPMGKKLLVGNETTPRETQAARREKLGKLRVPYTLPAGTRNARAVSRWARLRFFFAAGFLAAGGASWPWLGAAGLGRRRGRGRARRGGGDHLDHAVGPFSTHWPVVPATRARPGRTRPRIGFGHRQALVDVQLRHVDAERKSR